MESLLAVARRYVEMGLSVVATNSHKEAIMPWRTFQQRLPYDRELCGMFAHPDAVNLAIVCGKVSGGLEVLDFDLKYDLNDNLFSLFWKKASAMLPGLRERLVVAQSRSGGYHVFYRCSKVGGNMKLAQRETTDQEKAINPKEKRKVLIETRGEAGIILVAPSPGYRFVQGNLSNLVVLSGAERDTLLHLARSFDQLPVQKPEPVRLERHSIYTHSPFDDYNNRGDIIGLLEKHGWTVVRNKCTQEKTVLLRPGQTKSRSSGDYHHVKGLFSVFTSSTEFEPNTGYRPSTVFAILECNGDFRQAAKRLLEMGYGRSYRQVRQQGKVSSYSRGK